MADLTGIDQAARAFQAIAPGVAFWSVRLMERRVQSLSVRQGVVQPISNGRSRGALVFVIEGEGYGYGATGDLSRAGLRRAVEDARELAATTAGRALFPADRHARPERSGSYRTPVQRPWAEGGLEERLALLHDLDQALQANESIVDTLALLAGETLETLYLDGDGIRIHQHLERVSPGLVAVANRGPRTQRRSFGLERARQGGLEHLASLDLPAYAPRVVEQALQLLDAPNCPQQRTDLILMPDQMILQIHESIGHPLELDRILGDERNYAGSSFVTPEMFGRYRYGSDLLNVSFDPAQTAEPAAYGFDDEGTPAGREYLIREGLLLRPLGGQTSQRRAGLPGVAAARACDWNRPAIDRMANLNVEPGDSSLAEMISSVEHGVLMETNRSWSIDDRRNKFQFGCEFGRLIQDGELGPVVRDPNYRGLSAEFWRRLDAVGDRPGFELMGVANCGKGEPNQMIRVGHASPPCLFRDVEVFGGD